MYRIAIITDIHGNIYALNAVMKEIQKKSVDFIYCLGDMIGIGPFSNEVLDTLQETDNLKMVSGNHDEAVLALLNNEPYPKSRVDVIPHHEWIAERLNKQHKSVLEKLPRIINPTIYEQSLHLIHYPLKQSFHNAHICRDPFDLTGMPNQENFTSLDALDGFSLVCFGHDHSSHKFTCNSTTFFNPGSVGCFNKPFARYGIIDINQNGYNLMQQCVPYELDKYVKELRKTSIPRKEIILSIYN
ncbi:metallophosphoesterase family protein [Virgibacillus litoralis]|uniref:Phosphodiesterase n=1 Tax=Virgibacillus litoralis TaxID=578221 RepID=A0ABS4HIN7_9BACI|nr:metallophosphoesterase family protein [Virgibacillus litoralis]MBP1950787.1 putative phosphodiesterase [Virgibacillus litoralis]